MRTVQHRVRGCRGHVIQAALHIVALYDAGIIGVLGSELEALRAASHARSENVGADSGHQTTIIFTICPADAVASRTSSWAMDLNLAVLLGLPHVVDAASHGVPCFIERPAEIKIAANASAHFFTRVDLIGAGASGLNVSAEGLTRQAFGFFDGARSAAASGSTRGRAAAATEGRTPSARLHHFRVERGFLNPDKVGASRTAEKQNAGQIISCDHQTPPSSRLVPDGTTPAVKKSELAPWAARVSSAVRNSTRPVPSSAAPALNAMVDTFAASRA